MNATKKRKRFIVNANRTRDPDKLLVQPKINQEMLETDTHNLWIAWTKSWGGKYNAEEPTGSPSRALARFTRWWTTVRGWNESAIPKGLFDKQNKQMKVRRTAPFSSDHPLSTTVPNTLSGCVSEATLRPNPRHTTNVLCNCILPGLIRTRVAISLAQDRHGRHRHSTRWSAVVGCPPAIP